MQKQKIDVTYKGKRATIVTCLSPERAEALRAQWADGVIVLERIHETPLMEGDGGGKSGRLWLIRTAARVLRIENWAALAAECAQIDHVVAPQPKEADPMRAFMQTERVTNMRTPAANKRSRTSRTDRMKTVAGTRRVATR